MRLKKAGSFVTRFRDGLGPSARCFFCLKLKRLNFEHLSAEKSSMNKIDSFFVLILVLLSGLAVTFKAAQYDLGDAQLLTAENRFLKNKILLLELKQKDLELSSSNPGKARTLASLSEVSSPVELDRNVLAEGLYKEARTECDQLKKNLSCLERIDAVVTQFPESKWAGQSLILLTGIYIKEKKYEQAADLVKIVRSEFKDEPEVLWNLKEIEKKQF